MVEYDVPAEMANALTVGQIEYPHTVIQLAGCDNIVGELIIDEKGGKLRFEGDTEKSAQIFFDEVIKKYAEAYL
jgi:hypothetical protein